MAGAVCRAGEALGAVFVEGWIFVFLAVTGLRLRLIRLVPKSIMLATSAGIGLYLAFIGLQNVEGLGVVSFDSTTLCHPGGVPPGAPGAPPSTHAGPHAGCCCSWFGTSRSRRASSHELHLPRSL